MNAIKKLLNAAETKYAAVGAALSVPLMASAAPAADPAQAAADKINGLVSGVGTVGAAILGLTLAAIGFFVIQRMAKRA